MSDYDRHFGFMLNSKAVLNSSPVGTFVVETVFNAIASFLLGRIISSDINSGED